MSSTPPLQNEQRATTTLATLRTVAVASRQRSSTDGTLFAQLDEYAAIFKAATALGVWKPAETPTPEKVDAIADLLREHPGMDPHKLYDVELSFVVDCLKEHEDREARRTTLPSPVAQPAVTGERAGQSGTPAQVLAQAEGVDKAVAPADATDNETDPEDLTDRANLILETMLEQGITSKRCRKTRQRIVPLVNRNFNPQSCNRDFATLTKRGYLEAKEGNRGGIWLTSKGRAEAERLRSAK